MGWRRIAAAGSAPVGQLIEAISDNGNQVEEMGDLLFALVNICRHLDIDPQLASTAATDKLHSRFRHVERALTEQDRTLDDTNLDQLEALWDTAKLHDTGDQPKKN